MEMQSYCENSRVKRCPTQRYGPPNRFLVRKSNKCSPGKQQEELTTDIELGDATDKENKLKFGMKEYTLLGGQ